MVRVAFALLAQAVLAAAASSQTLIYTLPGEAAGDRFGQAVRATRDVNGDGFDDLIAASATGFGGLGYARVISGQSGTVLHTFAGSAPGDHFGAAVDSADVNADGRADLIVGAPFSGPGGRAYVFDGVSGILLYSVQGSSAGDHFGFAVCGLDDLDGDGPRDFAVAAVDADPQGSSSGSVRVISGYAGSTIRTLTGASANELFGYALAAIGDLDQDGAGEIAVGSPFVVSAGNAEPGRVQVFSGRTGALLRIWTGAQANDAFGRAVADAGDVDGDSLSDVIAGAPQPMAGLAGYARVFSGANGALIAERLGDSAGDLFGAAVSTAGDADLDGRADFAVGAPHDDDLGASCGMVRVFSSGASGATLASLYGSAAGHELGTALDGRGDANGDLVRDLAAAAPGDASPAPGAGSARSISTRTLSLASDVHLVPLGAGLPQTMSVDFGPAYGGAAYVALGTLTGTAPGTPFSGLTVPLNLDRYLGYTLKLLPGGPIGGNTGTLDPQGRATVLFAQPGFPALSQLVGLTFHHA